MNDFEAEIFASPESEELWAVYGDWLASQGDPRGELVAVQRARKAARGAELARLLAAEDALLEDHAEHFYGPLENSEKARTNLDWDNGFVSAIDGAGIGGITPFLAHASAKFVRRLSSVDSAFLPPIVSSVRTHRTKVPELFEHAPMRELELRWFHVVLPEVRHAGLERLAIGNATEARLQALAVGSLPRLQHLGVGSVRHGRALTAAVEHLNPRTVDLELNLLDDADAIGPILDRVITLTYGGRQNEFADLARCVFSSVRRLTLFSSDPIETFFDVGPSLPALEDVQSILPNDSAPFFRALGRRFGRRIRRLRAVVTTCAAGQALFEQPYEALEHLDLPFAGAFVDDLAETTKMFAVDAFPKLRSVKLAPIIVLPALAQSPMAARLVELSLTVNDDDDVALWIQHRDRFTSLETLSVGGERWLEPASLTALCTSVANVIWEPRVR